MSKLASAMDLCSAAADIEADDPDDVASRQTTVAKRRHTNDRRLATVISKYLLF